MAVETNQSHEIIVLLWILKPIPWLIKSGERTQNNNVSLVIILYYTTYVLHTHTLFAYNNITPTIITIIVMIRSWSTYLRKTVIHNVL